ncbi:unnamed protein product, partial [Mesorhabditis belari]|uniref:Neurotransmitter-gated ion-channel ligand-binding domain-containing protein n=1 Tax=Mesorhabditis belari TaxID=2138241 RepID=A0AAF3JC67_9BILA
MLFPFLFCLFFRLGDSLFPTALLENYDKRVIPYYIDNETVFVNTSLPFIFLDAMYPQEQTATFLFEVCMEWIDKRLQYDPDAYNNDSMLFLPIGEIWTPPYNLYQTLENKVLAGKRGDYASIEPSGRVVIFESQFAKVRCGNNISMFPFDIEVCGLELYSNVNQSVMRFQGVKRNDSNVSGNSEFEIKCEYVFTKKSDNSDPIDQQPAVSFSIAFTRRGFYYAFVIVFPSVLITILTITGILFPYPGDHSSDTISIGLAAMLALVIILSVVADHIPHTQEVPLIGGFVMCCIFLCIIAVINGLIFEYLLCLVKKNDQLPGCLNRLFLYYQKKVSKKSTPRRLIKICSFLTFLVLQALLIWLLFFYVKVGWVSEKAAVHESDIVDLDTMELSYKSPQ